jgi:UDP-glucose 4-epimerase
MSSDNKKTLFITGGCGFIGSHCAEELQHEFQVICIDNFYSGLRSNLIGINATIIEADITDTEKMSSLIKEYQPYGIIHLAAIASVQACIEKPRDCFEVNQNATVQLLELSAQNNIKRFVFASSAAVYGDEPTLPKNEFNSSIHPISSYGIDKFASEQYVLEYARRGKIHGVALRFFNVYGPRQNPNSPYSGVLSIFAKAVNDQVQPSLTVFGDGEQTRDFVFVKDVVGAIKCSLDSDDMNQEVFNVGTGKGVSLLEIIKLMSQISAKNIKITFKDERSGDIKRSVASNQKILDAGVDFKFEMKNGLAYIVKGSDD